MTADITIEDDCQQTANDIETELLAALGSSLPQSDNRAFILAARDSQGSLVGGLTSCSSYGWLLIKTLWVSETYRGQGIGTELMAVAERRALEAGCHASWLDTSNPDSMRFYTNLGYETFGELKNAKGQFPETHQRWFMQKALASC